MNDVSGFPGAGILWPPRYAPDRVPVHVSNQRTISATPELVWAWLTRAPLWPTWYANARHVRSADGGLMDDLAQGSEFRWETFGVAIKSRVLEFVPYERIAWDAKGFGVDAYHAWLLTPQGEGCHVLTEESQHGLGARLMNFIFPHRMYDGHDLWLRSLEIKCRSGRPPEI